MRRIYVHVYRYIALCCYTRGGLFKLHPSGSAYAVRITNIYIYMYIYIYIYIYAYIYICI